MLKTFTIEELLDSTKPTSEGCLEWSKARTKAGYAQKWDGQKVAYVHRIICELKHGDITGLDVMHSCDNPPCINPSHLSVGTRRENVRDMITKGRQVVKASRGEAHGMAKLTAKQVAAIRKKRASGALLREIAEAFNISIANVHLVTSKKHWKDIENG